MFSLCEHYNVCLYLQETLLECLRNKFKKESSPLLHLKTLQEMKKKFGAKRKRSGDYVPLEDLAGQQVPVDIFLTFLPNFLSV